MTKYYYTCEKDRQLIDKSFYNIAYIIFGQKNVNKINTFKNFWEQEVSNVNVFPQGSLHDRINSSTPGICREDKNTKKLIIEMFGYKGANILPQKWIKHEATHEICHSFVNLLPKSKSQKGITKCGIYRENDMGMIKETNKLTGELVNQHYYGKMFNETMMDIISSMAINYFDSNCNSKSVNKILNTNYNDWGNEKTGYSIFTTLTRLSIAAFSNVANPDYDSIVESGCGFFDAKTRLKDGKEYLVNDFLYGIVYDPLHIEEEFDKFMGNDSYRIFCEYLDRLFYLSLKKQKLPGDGVMTVMNILPDFLNKKLDYYENNNLMNSEIASQIRRSFNRIWNTLGDEYNILVKQGFIDDIKIRAGRKV